MWISPQVRDVLVPRLKELGASHVVAHGKPGKQFCTLAIKLTDYEKQAPAIIDAMRNFRHSHLDVMMAYDILDATEELPTPRVAVML